jgi:hypothetical protein
MRGLALDITVETGGIPVIEASVPKMIRTRLTNLRAADLTGTAQLIVPNGWVVTPVSQPLSLSRDALDLSWQVTAPSRSLIENSNRLSLEIALYGRSAEPAIPIVLIGTRHMRVSGPYPLEGEGASQSYGLESADYPGKYGPWCDVSVSENKLPFQDLLAEPGMLYAQIYLWSERAKDVKLAIPSNCPAKLWLNGVASLTCLEGRLLRPNYGGDGSSYLDTSLQAGWNEVTFLFVRRPADPAFDGHFILCDFHDQNNGIIDVTWTRYPEDPGVRTA